MKKKTAKRTNFRLFKSFAIIFAMLYTIKCIYIVYIYIYEYLRREDMAKKITVILAALLVCILALCGCESFSAKKISGGDPNVEVQSNGGSVVKQGEYIYFINGESAGFSKPEDNYFGEVIKGGIARAKVNADGSVSEAQLIVPKQISSQNAASFSIFGEWIYYVSSTTKTDNKGTLNSDQYMFYRTKIDGTGTQLITVVNGSSISYKFTSDALIFLNSDTLYTVNYKNKMNDEKAQKVHENVTKAVFPKTETYNPNEEGYKLTDYVYFTASVKDQDGNNENFNELYAVKSNGKDKKLIIGKTSYSESPTAKQMYSIGLKSYAIEDNGISLFYSKTYKVGDTSTIEGIYALMLDSTLAFSAANEKAVLATSSDYTNVFPISYEAGLIIYDNTEILLVKDNVKTKVATGTITPLFIKSESKNAGNNGYYLYYLKESSLAKLLIMNEDKSFTTEENEKLLISKNISTSFTSVEVIGNTAFYMSSADETYMHIFDISKYKEYDENSTTQTIDLLIGLKDTREKKADS